MSAACLSKNPEETLAHARNFAAGCTAGTVLRLHGTLGAGKTTWVKGFLSGLGGEDEAASPSFALMHEYRTGRLPVYHWDLYRLEPGTDWSVLDLIEHLPSDGITLVEWPERYPGAWPRELLWDLTITPHPDESRTIHLTPIP